MTQKILISRCFGGFGISREAFHLLRELGHEEALIEPDIGETFGSSGEVRDESLDCFLGRSTRRDDPRLIQVFEAIGSERMSSRFAKLKVVEIPDGVGWEIEEYDGREWVSEVHRTWH